MREIAENLDVQSQGDFSESWYQQEYASRRIDPNSGEPVPNITQAVLSTKDAKDNYGIELDTTDNRRFKEVFGDEENATIREHKHISGKLRGDQETQFEDNIKIVRHNREIDAKVARQEPLGKSPQDTPVIIEKDGKKFRPNRLMYTFATPEGAKANPNFMYTQLEEHGDFLSVEIINSQGQRKTVDYSNRNELTEPVLSQWLYPATNNSKNSS